MTVRYDYSKVNHRLTQVVVGPPRNALEQRASAVLATGLAVPIDVVRSIKWGFA